MINPNRVEEIFMDCLFKEDEPMEPRVEVEGILNRFGFHPDRLNSHIQEVIEMLEQLPPEFMSIKKGGGGGMSFLNACMTKTGEQWTGMHLRMDQLFCLGMGLNLVTCLLPREVWRALPGGMRKADAREQTR